MINDEEFFALGRIAFAMLQYPSDAASEIARWQWNYDRLSDSHKALVAHIPTKILAAKRAVQANAAVLQAIVHEGERMGMVGPALTAANAYNQRSSGHVSAVDRSKVAYVLKNIVRDWSADGAAEREQCYGWMLERAAALFPDRHAAAEPPRVLVPGAGLARLPVEFAARGFDATGNEFSFYMLLASSFMMNCVQTAGALRLQPYALVPSNQRRDDLQMREVAVPDISAVSMMADSSGRLAMTAGDFVEVFSTDDEAAAYDVVATAFFVDTAHNVLEYLEVIHHCLRPGGYWINCGPLLYHWTDHGGGEEASLELSADAILEAAQQMGFVVVETSDAIANYMGDQESLHSVTYTALRWVLQKEASSR